MARLFPPDFNLGDLEMSEQRVAQSFIDGLDDSWYVVPSIPIVVDKRDAEIDMILLSQDHGMFIVEVKGGFISVEDGKWKTSEHYLKKSPFDQVTNAKHALIKRLKKNKVDLTNVDVQHIVAFPDNADFPEAGGGPDAPRSIIFTKMELSVSSYPLGMLAKKGEIFSNDVLIGILRWLKPTVHEIEVIGGYITGAKQRITKASVNELKLLFGLDENRRVILRGGAGTGKTFLGINWAKRALRRGEKTLVVCFNRALGQDLYHSLVEYAEETSTSHLLRVGSYHAIMNAILGDLRPDVPRSAPQDFWTKAHADRLLENLDKIEDRFDTIIIDEGQDFHESWFGALEALLTNTQENRLFVSLDEEQDLFVERPGLPQNATLFRLHNNVRSTSEIAKLGQKLGGAKVPHGMPVGLSVDTHVVGGAKERKKKIGVVLTKIVNELNIPLSQILILVPHNSDIDELTSAPINDFVLKKFDERDEESVACATIHSTKGLERLAVIVASLDDEVPDNVIYVALTRASVYLSIIGTQAFIDAATGKREVDQSTDLASPLTADPSDDISDVERVSQ